MIYVDNAMNRKLGRVGKEKGKKEEKKAEQTPADYVAQLRKERKKAPKKEKVKKTLKSTKSGYNAKKKQLEQKPIVDDDGEEYGFKAKPTPKPPKPPKPAPRPKRKEGEKQKEYFARVQKKEVKKEPKAPIPPPKPPRGVKKFKLAPVPKKIKKSVNTLPSEQIKDAKTELGIKPFVRNPKGWSADRASTELKILTANRKIATDITSRSKAQDEKEFARGVGSDEGQEVMDLDIKRSNDVDIRQANMPKPVFEEIGGGVVREIKPIALGSTGNIKGGFRSGRKRTQAQVITPSSSGAIDTKRTGKKTREELLDMEKGPDMRWIKLVRNPHYYKGTDRTNTFEFLNQDQVEKSRGTGEDRVRVKEYGGGIVPKQLGKVKPPPKQPKSNENFLKGRKVRELSKEEKTQYEKVKKANQRYRVAIVKYNATIKPTPKRDPYIRVNPEIKTSKLSIKEALAKLGKKTDRKNEKGIIGTSVGGTAPYFKKGKQGGTFGGIGSVVEWNNPEGKGKPEPRISQGPREIKGKKQKIGLLDVKIENPKKTRGRGDVRKSGSIKLNQGAILKLRKEAVSSHEDGIGFRNIGPEMGGYKDGLHTNIRGPSGKTEQKKLRKAFLTHNKDYIENKEKYSKTDYIRDNRLYSKSKEQLNKEKLETAHYDLARSGKLGNLKHPAYRPSTYYKDAKHPVAVREGTIAKVVRDDKGNRVLTPRQQNENVLRRKAIANRRYQYAAGSGMGMARKKPTLVQPHYFSEGSVLDGNNILGVNDEMLYGNSLAPDGDNYQ